ncbi:uncharacterized protein [Procambarus clarkii]|uniref:uncharacterized protein n=1 Tax=Procambarus clarkii TaxID=6728 RepID=UPI0037448693
MNNGGRGERWPPTPVVLGRPRPSSWAAHARRPGPPTPVVLGRPRPSSWAAHARRPGPPTPVVLGRPRPSSWAAHARRPGSPTPVVLGRPRPSSWVAHARRPGPPTPVVLGRPRPSSWAAHARRPGPPTPVVLGRPRPSSWAAHARRPGSPTPVILMVLVSTVRATKILHIVFAVGQRVRASRHWLQDNTVVTEMIFTERLKRVQQARALYKSVTGVGIITNADRSLLRFHQRQENGQCKVSSPKVQRTQNRKRDSTSLSPAASIF